MDLFESILTGEINNFNIDFTEYTLKMPIFIDNNEIRKKKQ